MILLLQQINLKKKDLLYCKWSINTGNGWKHLQGIKEGQTHVDRQLYQSTAYWAHPIDIHYSTKGLQGKILCFYN